MPHPIEALHEERFPGESPAYRSARNELLAAERELVHQIERVAALRRRLPLGGVVPEDYTFAEEGGSVRLSELFAPGQETLILYSFMYGPSMARPCPMCTSLLDSLDGTAPHVRQRVSFAVVAKSPIARIRAFADGRDWSHLRLLSSADNTYNRDYHGEEPDQSQNPCLNVFVRRDGQIHHFYATELLFVDSGEAMDARHVDLLWPLWNLLDLTPDGRGTDWYPALSY